MQCRQTARIPPEVLNWQAVVATGGARGERKKLALSGIILTLAGVRLGQPLE